jgi:hypothetical protein
MLIDSGVGALPKVLEAYMTEALWLPNSPEIEWHGPMGVGPTWGDGCLVWFGFL